MSIRSLLLAGSALLAFSLAPSAQAVTISSSDLPSGESFVDLGFASASAGAGVFAHKVEAGFDSVGVLGGWEGGEIDLAGPESITFAFDTPQVVTELVLANLYAAGEHDDVADEQALVRVTFADDSTGDYVLALSGAYDASFTGGATVTNVSPGLFGDGGAWSIANPFGNLAVKQLELLAIGPDSPTDMRNNDYGFLSLTVVPEPGSLVLLSIGLAGLAFAGRPGRH